MSTDYFTTLTSGFYALMDASDRFHDVAATTWSDCVDKDRTLITSNYIVVETTALMQNRLGFEAATVWQSDILGIVDVFWIDESLHNQSRELWLGLGRNKVSFVDCTSFTTIRRLNIGKIFAFDRHFIDQGLELITQ